MRKYLIISLILIVLAGYFGGVEAKPIRTFYVDASNGNDSNNGTTPESAWKSIEKVNALQFDIKKDKIVRGEKYTNSFFKPGDAILFKCEEKWKEQLYILSSGTKDNPVTFGTYGSGSKPIISGAECFTSACGVNADWEKIKDNIYRLKTENDVGVVTEDGLSLIFVSWEPKKNNLVKMEQGSSLFDYEKKLLYLWTTKGDSPDAHRIEGGVRKNAIRPLNSEYFIVKDVEITHTSECGIKTENIKHAVFDNLDIHTCGGLWSKGGAFYHGNGITITYDSEDVVIQNSRIHDVYDSAVSPQAFWKKGLTIKDIIIKNNEMYNAPHSVVEITNWADNSRMSNILVENNKIYNGGKGFSSKHQWNKPSGGPGILITIGKDRKSTIENILIKNNEIFDCTLEGVAVGPNSGPVEIINNNIHDNKGAGVIVFDDKKPTITRAIIEKNRITDNGDDILTGGYAAAAEKENMTARNGDLDFKKQLKKYIK
ncbi:MAG: hypothetical protein A2231_06450 [Candidatus Firestonebacteria bacterium RIFOXYA2_FULL_40_8]|nr:MAG: hypothetical protein A2231_06450 [Candidatus Firestonebacteria bacterium RIFOXYA2_FULL_40_8]